MLMASHHGDSSSLTPPSRFMIIHTLYDKVKPTCFPCLFPVNASWEDWSMMPFNRLVACLDTICNNHIDYISMVSNLHCHQQTDTCTHVHVHVRVRVCKFLLKAIVYFIGDLKIIKLSILLVVKLTMVKHPLTYFCLKCIFIEFVKCQMDTGCMCIL